MNKLSISISLGYDLLVLVDKKLFFSKSSKRKFKNRSEYIEHLIKEDLSKDKDFSKELKTLNK